MIWFLWLIVASVLISGLFVIFALFLSERRNEDSAEYGAEEGRWPE